MGLQECGLRTQDIVDGCHKPKLKTSSHYHKSGDFQDNLANREFLGLT
jgi:hypothetical protein